MEKVFQSLSWYQGDYGFPKLKGSLILVEVPQRFLWIPYESSNTHRNTWEALLTHLDGSIDVESIFQTFILLQEDYELPLWVTREKLEEKGNGDVPYLYLGFVALI